MDAHVMIILSHFSDATQEGSYLCLYRAWKEAQKGGCCRGF